MDEFVNHMRTETDVAPRSLDCYCRNVRTVAQIMGVPKEDFYKDKNLNFLSDAEKVNKELMESGKSQNTIITYLASIIKALECHNTKADGYKALMGTLMAKRKEEDEKHEKTAKQDANWASMGDLRGVMRRLEGVCRSHDRAKRRGDKKAYDDYQNHLIAFLYVGDPENHPPMRLDYCPMRIVSKMPEGKEGEEESQDNYLLCKSRNKKQFVFNNYKTAKSYGSKIIDLSPKMNSVMNRFLDVRKQRVTLDPGAPLLLNSKGAPMNENTLCKQITRIFKPTGKNITANLIRHFHISENHPAEEVEAKKADADKMCHSVETQGKYAKK